MAEGTKELKNNTLTSVPWRHSMLLLKETELHRGNHIPEVNQHPISSTGTLVLLQLLQT